MQLLLIPVVLLTVFLSGVPQQLVLNRGMSATASNAEIVPLATSSTFPFPSGLGLLGRKADHATVAMNDDLDIAVAFHSSRAELGNGLKQVEIAYFEYQSNDTWEHVETVVVGSVDYHPIFGLPQTRVKCERPDIIAVGNMFFVVWTRRYSENPVYSNQEHQPAVLECAWIARGSGATIDVFGALNNPGLGFELQAHVPNGTSSQLFEVLECAGVPDAVVLNDSSLPTTTLKVGVAYPHQKIFSDPNDPVDNQIREFTMRFVTCKFDTTTSSISTPATGPIETHPTVQFNGPKALNQGTTAGLILPDLAPSSEDNAFWIAAEGQIMVSPNPPQKLPHGVVKLQYWKLVGGTWQELAGKTYMSSPSSGYQSRRRPNLSSYPPGNLTDGLESVSIAFNWAESDPGHADQSFNFTHEEWDYSNGSITAPALSPMTDWVNSSAVDDVKPVPLRGIDSPTLIRKCYFTQSDYNVALPKDIISFDAITNQSPSIQNLPVGQANGELTRPAAAYQHKVLGGGAPSEHIAVAFEGKANSTTPLRIRLGVE